MDMAAAKATEVMAAAEATATTVMVAAAVKATADILAADRIPTAAEDMTTDTRQVVIFVCDAFGTNVVPMLFANCNPIIDVDGANNNSPIGNLSKHQMLF